MVHDVIPSLCTWYRSCLLLIMLLFLVNSFSPATFEITEYKCSQPVQCCKKCFPVIGFRKLLNKPLQIRIRCDHKCSDRDLQFLTLCCKVQTSVGDLPVQPETVFIIPFTNF